VTSHWYLLATNDAFVAVDADDLADAMEALASDVQNTDRMAKVIDIEHGIRIGDEHVMRFGFALAERHRVATARQGFAAEGIELAESVRGLADPEDGAA
jgi:hypothetical protein